jgi:hypothetical protein
MATIFVLRIDSNYRSPRFRSLFIERKGTRSVRNTSAVHRRPPLNLCMAFRLADKLVIFQ